MTLDARYSSVILSAGGIRSLVAIATTIADSPTPAVTLLHFKRDDTIGFLRLDSVRVQAEHFGVQSVVELPHPPLPSWLKREVPIWPSDQFLMRPLHLLLGLTHASEAKATQLIWPLQFDGDYDRIARATEQIVLVEHLA